uniref:Uncharacterized protein n=1 Tax=Davidia involucrata TaxID=16924 RepID=A0A5B7BD06_DAVIN
MQASHPLPSSPSLDSYCEGQFAKTAAEVGDDFRAKLKLNASDGDRTEKSSDDQNQQQLEGEFEAEEDDDDDEFSFVCNGADTSPISADDAFINGEIRPIFPLFNRDLLFADDSLPSKNDLPLRPPVKKVFIEASSSGTDEVDAEAAGPYCAWSKKAIEASPEICKKSNSTGFSKLWRFRDLVNRSNSDGRDAFVFLNSSTTTTSAKREEKVEKSDGSSDKKIAGEAKVNTAGVKAKAKKGKKGETKASLSAHEMHYVRNRALREEDRRRSYLPYRPELVGFFTNVNGGMSRNVHPF